MKRLNHEGMKGTTMSEHAPVCAKCDTPMERGFLADFTHGAVMVSGWFAGAPKKSFWLGTKIDYKQVIPTATFRCPTCGYLESYANPDYAAE